MLKTLASTLESKKFVVSFLTVIAMIAAWKGLDVPVDKLIMLATPVMVAIGAQGWADQGKEAVKMQAKLAANSNVPVQPIQAVPAQKGFALLEMLMFVSLGFGSVMAVATIQSCSGTQIKKDAGTIADGLIDCAKVSPSEVLTDVTRILLSGADGWQDELKSIGVFKGETVLACAVKTVETVLNAKLPGQGPVTSQPMPGALRASSYVSQRGWKFK